MTEKSKAGKWGLYRAKSTPPRVVTTGVSCRMGVGGRRGRKRQPARLRKVRAWADDELIKAEKLLGMRPASRADLDHLMRYARGKA